MYELDFVEPKMLSNNVMTDRLKEVSYEDKRFLRIMNEQTIKVGNPCQTPLPLQNPAMMLPNNRRMVETRAQYLKRRFERDPKYFQHYKSLMDEIISKVYAKQSDDTSQNGRVCYLPHHGVFRPLKPEKISIAALECRGRSINKELRPGPDLTNQVVGTLTKFRQDEVAFVADIEKMFFQVYVGNEHRSLLGFLWWQNGDISRQPADHEMCVHVFGGTSSLFCSNYALKKTAVDGETKFGKETTETLQNNFYVDDLLKSVDDEDEAIKLIKEVKAICASGRFRLTKFLCNSKKVLKSISEDDRRAGVNDKDLVSKVPSENILGVYWNTETDTFEFRKNLKQKPLTRRGTLSLLSSPYDPLGFAAPFLIPGKLLFQQL